MKKYIMVVEWVTPTISWDVVESDKVYKDITDYYLGDKEKGFKWYGYYPEKYNDVWVVDAQEVLIVRDTFEECVKEAIDSTKDQMMAYYIDGLNSEDKELMGKSFNEYIAATINRLNAEMDDVRDTPTLKSSVE